VQEEKEKVKLEKIGEWLYVGKQGLEGQLNEEINI